MGIFSESKGAKRRRLEAEALRAATDPIKLAADFTKQWQGSLGKVESIYDDAYASVGNIDAMADQFGQEFDSFQATYTPYRDQLLEMSSADAGRRAELSASFMKLATPDLDGAGNRAMAGVAQQGAIAEGQIQRTMTRGGGNPSSSGYQGMVRQNALDTAKNKVLAGTTARNQERTIGLNTAATGMQIFDPTKSINAAVGIDLAANDLLTGKANATLAATNARTGIASGLATNVTNPLGEAAGTYQGMAMTRKFAQEDAAAERADKVQADNNSRRSYYNIQTGAWV